MGLVLVIGGGLGWFVRRATVQRDAVRAIEAAGGNVEYDFQRDERKARFPGPGDIPPGLRISPPAPKWLVDLIGIDFFADVTSVDIPGPQSDAVLAHVGRLHRLERLGAGYTRVTDAGLAHLRGLSGLRSLWCAGTPGLTDAGLAHLAGLGQLESLLIEGTPHIEGPGLAHLAGLNRLKVLFIPIETDAGLPSLSRLTGLRSLIIEMKVTDAALAQLSRLTWLEVLSLGGETGSDAGMAHLRSLTNLKRLRVFGPWFTDDGLAPVSEMDHLAAFSVSDTTSVTAGGLSHLRRQRPSLSLGVDRTGEVSPDRTALLRSALESGATPAGPAGAAPPPAPASPRRSAP
jgi:hypothetical protein